MNPIIINTRSITLIFLFVSYVTFSQNFNFLPSTVGDNQVIEYTQFTLSYNEQHEQADWVAYELTKEEARMELDRNDVFRVDPNVSTGSATPDDYTSTGFDKGHLCPAADNNMSLQANKESFFMSNMSPQIPSFNQGIWRELEKYARIQAMIYDTIYVVTGPVFVHSLGKIGENEVTIPGYYYKILMRFEKGSPTLIGFVLPNVGSTGDIKEYAVPVNTIETMTGLDFFPELNNTEENRVESRVSFKKMGF